MPFRQPASTSHTQIPSSLLRVLMYQGTTEITTPKIQKNLQVEKEVFLK